MGQIIGNPTMSAGVRFRLAAALLLIAAACSHAAPPSWTFNPPKAGRALYDGGWTLEYQLGGVNASPEFSFPIQLVYLTTREQKGLFGSEWFCPQLETSLVPKAQGIFVWAMPSGGVVGFKVDPRRSTEYRSFDGNWRAKATASRQVIFNEDGWRFTYSRGRIESAGSPTGRLLEFLYSGSYLASVQIRDPGTGARRVLVALGYGQNKRVTGIEINGQRHHFSYIKDGPDDRLAAWSPPLGRPLSFGYAESGILARSIVGDGKEKEDITNFTTAFVTPFVKDKPAKEPNAKKHPKNRWLTADNQFQYTYGRDSKIKDKWNPALITIESRTGLSQQSAYNEKRGIVTASRDGIAQKTYYYRAPGQKYDGKLRRVEENGKLKAEYRYARKTGLLAEMIDAKGVITFFDYPANWKPSRRELWEPKPVRIRRGTRKTSETISEFTYDDRGLLVAAKDVAGQVTRYSYTSRGELESITDPAGGKTSFTYDGFGRRTGVTRNGVRESVEYDDQGRVKARIAVDGSRTEFVIDKRGLLAAVKRDGKTVIEYLHDETGRLIGERDPLGRVKKIERDKRGNLLAEHAPNGSVTRYEYDEFNRRIAQIDGNGNRISFDYDPAGRLIKQVNRIGGTLTWEYDAQGRLTGRTNGEQTIRYTYGEDGKLAAIDYGEGQRIDYAYNEDGRIRIAATPASTFEYMHDKLGRVDATRVVLGGEEQLLRYRYNARGQRAGMILARLEGAVPPRSGRIGRDAAYQALQQTEYQYDAAGRLSAIISNGKPAISYGYDEAERQVRKQFGNGMIANIGYDSMGRLARVEFRHGAKRKDILESPEAHSRMADGAWPQFNGGSLGAPLLLGYQWDAASQLTRRSWNGEVQRYEYDPSGQLLKVIDDATGKTLEAYVYDKAGNMLEKVINGEKTLMTYNAANQLVTVASASLPMNLAAAKPAATSANALTYTYDKAGRMLGHKGGALSAYGWLDKVVTLTQPDGAQIGFEYWPDGQLAAKRFISRAENGIRTIVNPISAPNHSPTTIHHSPGTAERFLWDGLALLRRDDTIYIIEPHPSGGVPIASHPIGNPDRITWHLNDLLGTTLATVQGSNVQFMTLTAFGQPLKLPGNVPRPDTLSADVPANPVPVTEQIPRTTTP